MVPAREIDDAAGCVDSADVHRQWMAAMRNGNFVEAWRQTDRIELARRQRERSGAFAWQPHHLIWNGDPFAGREVRIRCNHGLGDTIQFARFVPWVVREAAAVEFLVQPALLSLFQGLAGYGMVKNGWSDQPVSKSALEAEIMELPYAYRCTVQTLPQAAYLPAEIIRPPADWAHHFRNKGMRLGLVWAASAWDSSRSIPLAELGALAPIRGIRYYSLQQGFPVGVHANAPIPMIPLFQETGEIVAAAAALVEMDLLITVDTMMAHLAGALGRPVWLLLQHKADWRWMDQRADSPWYPTMRIFRQSRPGDWAGLMKDVAARLQAVTCRQSIRSQNEEVPGPSEFRASP